MANDLSQIEQGLSSGNEQTRWDAAIAAEDLIREVPLEIWQLVLKYGSVSDPELRTIVATCLLEHLLEHFFDLVFPLLEMEIQSGNRLLGLTFLECWKFGQSSIAENSMRWDNLNKCAQDVQEQ